MIWTKNCPRIVQLTIHPNEQNIMCTRKQTDSPLSVIWSGSSLFEYDACYGRLNTTGFHSIVYVLRSLSVCHSFTADLICQSLSITDNVSILD